MRGGSSILLITLGLIILWVAISGKFCCIADAFNCLTGAGGCSSGATGSGAGTSATGTSDVPLQSSVLPHIQIPTGNFNLNLGQILGAPGGTAPLI